MTSECDNLQKLVFWNRITSTGKVSVTAPEGGMKLHVVNTNVKLELSDMPMPETEPLETQRMQGDAVIAA
jgi:hypothetical protein